MNKIIVLTLLLCNSILLANQTPEKVFAMGVKDDYEAGTMWSVFDVHAAKEKIVNNTGSGSTEEKDTRSLPADLGYHSLQVENNIKISEDIDLTINPRT